MTDTANADGALVAALAKAQGKFPTLERTKTATVPGKNGRAGYSYSYADLGDVLAKIRPVLSEHELAVVQRTELRDGKTILVTELLHADGGRLASEVDVGQSTASPQQFGGSLTYLRRYSIVTLLGVAAEEDRDAQDVEPARQAAAPPPALAPPIAAALREADEARLAELRAALEALGLDVAAMRVAHKAVVDSLGYFPDGFVGFAKLVATVKAAPAAEARAAQDREAEQPDPPASTDDGYEERIDDARAAEAEQPDHAGEDPPPPAGTVEEPDVEGANLDDVNDRDRVERLYRAAGCVCANPLAGLDIARGERKPEDLGGEEINDACPLKGHGIPF